MADFQGFIFMKLSCCFLLLVFIIGNTKIFAAENGDNNPSGVPAQKPEPSPLNSNSLPPPPPFFPPHKIESVTPFQSVFPPPPATPSANEQQPREPIVNLTRKQKTIKAFKHFYTDCSNNKKTTITSIGSTATCAALFIGYRISLNGAATSVDGFLQYLKNIFKTPSNFFKQNPTAAVFLLLTIALDLGCVINERIIRTYREGYREKRFFETRQQPQNIN
jgi:hypothetical protein